MVAPKPGTSMNATLGVDRTLTLPWEWRRCPSSALTFGHVRCDQKQITPTPTQGYLKLVFTYQLTLCIYPCLLNHLALLIPQDCLKPVRYLHQSKRKGASSSRCCSCWSGNYRNKLSLLKKTLDYHLSNDTVKMKKTKERGFESAKDFLRAEVPLQGEICCSPHRTPISPSCGGIQKEKHLMNGCQDLMKIAG